MIISDKIYEGLRWTVSIVLPAISTFFLTLADAWGWDVPTEAIVTSISALSLFLGTVFGISKITYDRKSAEKLSAKKQKS